jgi:plasmid stability protein
MRQTIAIRADPALRAAIAERAAAQGKTVSAFVRDVLQQAVEDLPVKARAGHLRGALDLPGTGGDPWRSRLRDRNWRP